MLNQENLENLDKNSQIEISEKEKRLHDRPIDPEEELISTKKFKSNNTCSDTEKASTLEDNSEGDLQMKDNCLESKINQDQKQNLLEAQTKSEEPKKKYAFRKRKRIVGQNGELKEDIVDDDDPNDKTYNIEEADEGEINETKTQKENVTQEKDIPSECSKVEIDQNEVKNEIEELKQSEAIDKEAYEKFKESVQNENKI